MSLPTAVAEVSNASIHSSIARNIGLFSIHGDPREGAKGAGRFSGKVLLSTPGTRIEGKFRLVSVGFDESFCQLTSAVNIGSLPNFPEKKAPPPACGGMGKALVR